MEKRYGKRVRDLVKETVTEIPIKSGKNAGKMRKMKTLGGKGKLTGKLIDKFQRYYGLAIRCNSDSIEDMRKAIWATYYHYYSTNENPQYDNCPNGAESWCAYQKALATTGVINFEHNYDPLPQDVLSALEPIYTDLSKDELLIRCLGGLTQNNDESLR